jgi:putative tryptophan/tyrosine transport system substrate-binding protein
MKRREFIWALGGAATWPLATRAQQRDGVRRIAVMMSNAEDDPEGGARAAAFRQGLAELGWSEGHNLRIDWHWSAGNLGRIRATAAEITAFAPDLIVANGSANLSALKQVTAIPIVFVLTNDPVGQGFISSLSQPGGNITGFTFVEYSMFGKSLELLKQLAPGIARVAFIFNPETSPYYRQFLPSFEIAARNFAVAVVTGAEVGSEAEIEAAVAGLGAKPGGGLIVPPDTYTLVHRGLIVEAVRRHRLPAIYSYRQHVQEGGLMAYGPDTADIFRRSASYVDRILKGANPAELPVQAPTKFELAINLATAAALGLTVPPTLAALADEVIE